MAQAELKIDKSKSDLVFCYKERIEHLFVVVLSVETPHESCSDVDKNVATVLLQSPSTSQEGVEKATIFLKAVLEESPGFITKRETFSQAQFDMLLRVSNTLECQYLAVLDFDPGAKALFMKGQQDRVEAVRHHISRLLMGQQLVEPIDLPSRQPSKAFSDSDQDKMDSAVQKLASFSLMCNRDSTNMLDKQDMYTTSGRDQENNLILESSHQGTMTMRSYSVTTDEDLEYPSISGPDLLDRGTGYGNVHSLPRTFAEVVSVKDASRGIDSSRVHTEEDADQRCKETVSDYTTSSSSDEDSGVNVVDKSDPRYESRLEFAVKLGYTERDLDRVIIRHGIDCNEDKLLHELIENSTGSDQQDGELSEYISSLPTTDIASSEVFLGVMKKVNKRESGDSGSNLRHIVIDGSNVAMSHGKNVFSCRGIKIAVDWFKQRGHKEITVFVPQWRKETSRPDTPITDQDILADLEKEGIVVFTPARRIKGRRVVCYDDRFVLKLAAETNGIVVSNDNYRDLLNENKEYRTVVDERLLMYTFVNDRFMPPDDPLGRRGPTLENFLCKEPTSPPTLPPECPYGRKCTYGNKCKYHHPERGSQPHKTVTEVLKEQATIKMQERAVKGPEPLDKSRRSKPKLTRTRSLALGEAVSGDKSSLSPLPPALQEPDSDVFSSRKLQPKTGGKTANYLREDRKKLEQIIALTSATDSPITKTQGSAVSEAPAAVPVSRSQGALSPVLAQRPRESSPSLLNVPYSSSQEGQLVSGHLLLAKKLSDEASESSFFSNESNSNRASPVALAGPTVASVPRQESAPFIIEKFNDRRASLQDHQKHMQYLSSTSTARHHEKSPAPYVTGPVQPSRQLSGYDPAYMGMSGLGGQFQSYPVSEKETHHNVLRRITSYSEQPHGHGLPVSGAGGMEVGYREHIPLKPQHSCPPDQFPSSPAPFTGHPFGGMLRQNSTSDPQLHMSGSGDAAFSPLHPTSMPPPMSMLDSRGGHSAYGSSELSSQHDRLEPGFYRSTSVQPLRTQQSFGSRSHTGLERQISEVLFGSHDQAAMGSSYQQQWDMGMYHSHPGTPTHVPGQHPNTAGLHSHIPGQQAGLLSSMGSNMASWPQNPVHGMPVSPVKSTMPTPRSFPSNQPILPNDQRYPLYYHLCGVFAEPRVRAVMNKYPDETDPQKLLARIVSEL